jgi:hypothetical protein
MRLAEHPVYEEFLRRFRVHTPTHQHIDLFQTRIDAPLLPSVPVIITVQRNTSPHK